MKSRRYKPAPAPLLKAKEDVKRALAVLNAHLLKKTFLASEAITAAARLAARLTACGWCRRYPRAQR